MWHGLFPAGPREGPSTSSDQRTKVDLAHVGFLAPVWFGAVELSMYTGILSRTTHGTSRSDLGFQQAFTEPQRQDHLKLRSCTDI